MKQVFSVVFVLLLTSCQSIKKVRSFDDNKNNNFYLLQHGEESLISKHTKVINVDREGFSLRFFNHPYSPKKKEYYAVRIAASLNKSFMASVNKGALINEVSYFKPGTGITPAESGRYESLLFNNHGHLYLTYENKDSKRLKLVDTLGDMLELEFEINTLNYEGSRVSLADSELSEFYLIVLIDKNVNGVVDDNEVRKFKININDSVGATLLSNK